MPTNERPKIDWNLLLSLVIQILAFALFFTVAELGSCWAIAHGEMETHNMIKFGFVLGVIGSFGLYLYFIHRPAARNRKMLAELLGRAIAMNEQLVKELEKKHRRVEGDEWKDN